MLARKALNPTRYGPVSAAIMDELADGQWHTVESAIGAGALAVMPGFSIRRAGGATGDPARDAVLRGTGDRLVARNNLERMRRRGRVERDTTKVRLSLDAAASWAVHRQDQTS